MWTLFLCASLLAPPGDSTVLLVRVLDVSDARMGGDVELRADARPEAAQGNDIRVASRAGQPVVFEWN